MSVRRPSRQTTAAQACTGAASHPAEAQAGDDAFQRRQVMLKLAEAGIAPTVQRRALGAMLLCAPVHITAEQLVRAAQTQALPVSRATVYNTLRLFTERGLLRELPIQGVETVYDSTATPHHHFYDLSTGEVSDIDDNALQVAGLDGLATSWNIDAVEVVVRGWRKLPVAVAAA
jgi:Fur family iron response transcriptional regulator